MEQQFFSYIIKTITYTHDTTNITQHNVQYLIESSIFLLRIAHLMLYMHIHILIISIIIQNIASSLILLTNIRLLFHIYKHLINFLYYMAPIYLLVKRNHVSCRFNIKRSFMTNRFTKD